MKENVKKIIIKKPIEEVFEFTTNPKNTHLWIPSIREEVCDKYPPEINTIYRNRGDDSKWHAYKVIELEKNKTFTLAGQDGNYFVRYEYKKIKDHATEMKYFEWVKEGELEKPFTEEVFRNLKKVMESGS